MSGRSPRFEIWGLTGGIASGKSTVARFFAEEGFPVLDADQLSRELSQPGGAGHAPILEAFGTTDRARLREIVFADPAARVRLEGILHPLIQAEGTRRATALASEAHARGAASPDGCVRVIYEAALLVEAKRHDSLAGLLVVEAPAELRRRWLRARDPGMTDAMIDKILAAQASDEERRQAATERFENSGSLEDLRAAVRALAVRRGWR